MLPKLGMLSASPHCGRQTPSVPPPFLMGIQLQISNGFPRFQQASQEASTSPQHSGELRQMNQCPPRDTICHIKSSICIEQNIYFMDADQFQQEITVSGSWNPGTSMLIREGAVSTWH